MKDVAVYVLMFPKSFWLVRVDWLFGFGLLNRVENTPRALLSLSGKCSTTDLQPNQRCCVWIVLFGLFFILFLLYSVLSITVEVTLISICQEII